jgi:hypothetical protein
VDFHTKADADPSESEAARAEAEEVAVPDLGEGPAALDEDVHAAHDDNPVERVGGAHDERRQRFEIGEVDAFEGDARIRKTADMAMFRSARLVVSSLRGIHDLPPRDPGETPDSTSLRARAVPAVAMPEDPSYQDFPGGCTTALAMARGGISRSWEIFLVWAKRDDR